MLARLTGPDGAGQMPKKRRKLQMLYLKRIILAAAALAGPALSASAQSWDATAHPQALPDNTPYCMLSLGEAAPLMNLMATPTGTKYIVVTEAFNDVPVGVSVSFSFGDGTNIPVAPAGKPQPDQYPGFISGRIPEETLSSILVRMSLNSYGEAPMTVTAGGKTQDFHLRSVAGDSGLFEECKGEL